MTATKTMEAISIRTLTPVGDSRYREQFGMYFADFIEGDVYEHRPGRTITEVDNIWQSLLQMNPHPLHFDNHYASKTEFGRVVVSALVTLPIVMGMTIGSTSANCVANLGWKSIELLAPVFVGDTVFAETTVLRKRLSASRPGQGVVEVAARGLKETGEVFMTLERKFLIPTREWALEIA